MCQIQEAAREDPGSNPAWGRLKVNIVTKKELWSRSYFYGTVICTYASRKKAVYATNLKHKSPPRHSTLRTDTTHHTQQQPPPRQQISPHQFQIRLILFHSINNLTPCSQLDVASC